MGVHTISTRIPILILIIFLSFHLSSSRRIAIETNKQVETQPSSWQYLANAPKESSRNDDEVYWNSFRTVPGGPNPLHN
ncbi:hypothetical protein BVRB_5g100690 [Beta vulgaris subsp. vulgaris]|nr:hypothetical protein BVRB_5g100690 [Beta vulgaris subsp. vulgaris]